MPKLGIDTHGIVHRGKHGTISIVRPGKSGGPGIEIEVPEELSDTYSLAAGDIVEGTTNTEAEASQQPRSDLAQQPHDYGYDELDQPPSRYLNSPFDRFDWSTLSGERLSSIRKINGLVLEDAADRPFPRTRRAQSERSLPVRRIELAASKNDTTGRMLDFVAPLFIGAMGIIHGPHGSGLTRTLRSVADGIMRSDPDCIVIILLLRARSEEITDWRRRFPDADIVCASASAMTPEQMLRISDLTLEAAMRQTELGHDVVLLVDSFTGLWSALLEAEEADAQFEADQSLARQKIREWAQRAGCFGNESPLGGSLGGSLTLIGTVWNADVDSEAEEEGDIHPHLRLMEHLSPEASWQVGLSAELSDARLYPAINLKNCDSRHEERLFSNPEMEHIFKARGTLPRNAPVKCYDRVMNSIEVTATMDELVEALQD